MRAPGMLILSEISIWLDAPTDHYHRRARYLITKHNIKPAVPSHGRVPCQWRWSDLQPLARYAPGARVDEDLIAA